ncbi:MAG: glucosaminidase domain-containing protein [Bacteroidales bacterium]
MILLKKFSCSALFILLLSSTVFSQKTSREEYIIKYKDLAVKQMKTHGVPASITLAQACLESGDGNSRLAKEANNHFGIKCHDWNGATIMHDDDAKNECFRKYSRVEDSYTDHSDFLRYRDRYKFLFDLEPTDYKAWAFGLKQAGYATNPQYPQQLIKIIEEYNLTQYDYFVDNVPPSPTKIVNDQEIKPVESSSLYKFSLSRKLFKKNGVAYIIGSKYDTYNNLAREYQLFTGELLRFNDLRKDVPIEDGTIIYVEKKRSSGDKFLDKHIVEKGETMYEISQEYGIMLRSLYKLNKMKKGDEPSYGQEINLK